MKTEGINCLLNPLNTFKKIHITNACIIKKLLNLLKVIDNWTVHSTLGSWRKTCQPNVNVVKQLKTENILFGCKLKKHT